MAADVYINPPAMERDFVARLKSQGKAQAVQLLASTINQSGQCYLWIKAPGNDVKFQCSIGALVVSGETMVVPIPLQAIQELESHAIVDGTYMVVGSGTHYVSCFVGLPTSTTRRMFVSQNLTDTATMQLGTIYFGFADAAPVTPTPDPGGNQGGGGSNLPSVWRMAFFGDSTVHGSAASGGTNEATYVSWRGPLQQALSNAGIAFTVVGTRNNPTRSNRGSAVNSAQGGSRLLVNSGVTSQLQLIDELAAVLTGPFDDCLFWISCGINDVGDGGASTSKLASDYITCINYLRSKFPGCRIAMCGMGMAMWIDGSYYDALDTAMSQLKAANSLNLQLNMRAITYSGVDFYEGTAQTHLSDSGALRVGATLYDQINTLLFNASSGGGTTNPGTAVNTVDTIVNDMKLRNDFTLRGYEGYSSGWYVGPGYVMMGNIANLSNSPSYWKSSNPGRYPRVANAILPWIVLFDGTQNAASNFRVQMRDFRLYIKRRSTNAWYLAGQSGAGGISGFYSPKAGLVGSSGNEDRITNSDGSVSVKLPSNTNLAWHGWSTKYAIDPNDIAAVHFTVQARLVVDNTSLADDRGSSQVGLQVGGDYYPDVNSAWVDGNGQTFTVPSVATSRTKKITNNWQAFSATTFSDVGVQEPGGGISESTFRALPPPIV